MISKKEFEWKDRIIKGIGTKGDFKISVVKITDVLKSARKRHQLSLLSTVLLGRAMAGVMLLASEMKGEERLQLRLEGSGPVGYVIAEANSVGEVRGYVGNPKAKLDYEKSGVSVGSGLGIGLLSLQKTLYNEADKRTSTIELVNGDVTSDLAHYLVQSEQVESAIKLDVGIGKNGEITHAGGLLVQRLPYAIPETIEKLQKHLVEFDQIDELLNHGNYIDDIMELAAGPMDVKELTRYPVHFFCRCNKKRFKDALAMIDYEELKDMEDEGQELVCHFCNETYHVTKDELEDIAMLAKAKMN